MKKTLLSFAVSVFSILAVNADVLWTTELGATGPYAEDAVLTNVDGSIAAPVAYYRGGWFNDWYGGEPYDLRFHELDSGYILGSNAVGVGDVGFTFQFGDFREGATIDSFQVGTFSWGGSEFDDYATLELLSFQVMLNGEVIYNSYPSGGRFIADFIENGRTDTYIEAQIPPIQVGPGDVISIVVDVTGYGLGYTNIGLDYIKCIGTAK